MTNPIYAAFMKYEKGRWFLFVYAERERPYCCAIPYVVDLDVEASGVSRDSVGNYHMVIVNKADGSKVVGEWLMAAPNGGGPEQVDYWGVDI